MLTCSEVTELVTEYLEKTMPFGRRLSFRLHIAMCDICRNYIRSMQQTIDTVGKLPEEPIPSDVKQALAASFSNWKKN